MSTTTQSSFPTEDVVAVITEQTDAILKDTCYLHANVPGWNTAVVEKSLKALATLRKPYKYIVTCLILQQNEAGVHASTSAYWDGSTDGAATYIFNNDTLHAVVTVYGLSV